MDYYRRQRLVLQTHQDSVARLQNDSLLIRLAMTTPNVANAGTVAGTAYVDLISTAVFGKSAVLQALVMQAKRDLGAISSHQPGPHINWETPEVTDEQWRRLVPRWYRSIQAHLTSLPAPRVQADFWFPPAGHPTSDTVIPIPGKFNLICGGGRPKDRNETNDGSETGIAYVLADNIKRWMALYGPEKLAVTLVRPAYGGTRFAVDDRTWEGEQIIVRDSLQEAEFWHWYDQTYHQLPVTEGVVVLHTDPADRLPDGRRVRVVQSLDTSYFNFVNMLDLNFASEEWGACSLISPEGQLLYKRDVQLTKEGKFKVDSTGRVENNSGDWSDVLHYVFTKHVAANTPPTAPLPVTAAAR